MVSRSGQRFILEKPVDIDRLAGSWTHVESTKKFMEEVREMWKTWKLR